MIRAQEYDELPEEEKQSSFHVALQLLPGSEKLEIEEMDLINCVISSLRWQTLLPLRLLACGEN
jgi:hypothetical protein